MLESNTVFSGSNCVKQCFFNMCGLKKDRLFGSKISDLLAAGVFGNSFSTFANGMLGQFSR